MGYKYHQFILKSFLYAVFENIICNLRIDSTQWVIKKVNVSFRIHGPSQTYSCFLSSGYIDSSFANNCIGTLCEFFDIVNQARIFESFCKQLLIPLFPEKDIVLDGSWIYKRFLLNVGNGTSDIASAWALPCFFHNWMEKRSLSTSYLANNNQKIIVFQIYINVTYLLISKLFNCEAGSLLRCLHHWLVFWHSETPTNRCILDWNVDIWWIFNLCVPGC